MIRHLVLALISLLVFTASGLGQEKGDWDILTVNETGVDRFREAYPDFNGKGVVIAVLDTGVDMGVEGLKTLPDGGVKVVDVRDFTGEGDLTWEEGHIVPDGDGEKLIDGEGRALTGFREAADGALYGRYYMAFIEESMFKDTSVKDLNGDGDSKDAFGVLIFMVADVEEEEAEAEGAVEGETVDETTEETVEEPEAEEEEEDDEGEEEEEKHGFRYEAVVDINGDGKLGDGVRLTDYWRKFQSFTLQGKDGDRKQLTMGLNFYPDEKRLSVHFDDGGHGTHVAGIAAGYRVHGQEGYHGMAPGAKVISLKIGNNRYAGGSTVTESVKKALDYGVKFAKDHEVPVVYNMSFGIGSERETTSAIEEYVDDLMWENPGVVFVTSAGNEGPGMSSVGTPAAAKRAIAVGALLGTEAAAAQYGCTLEKEVPFIFSSRGGDTYKPDIMAQGSASSTVPPWGDRDHMHGTSMASPAAAGAIALLVDGLVRNDPAYEVDNRIVHRAVKNTGRAPEGLELVDYGGGVLDLPAAFEYARFLCAQKEQETIREYRITNRGPAPGFGPVAYWRVNPAFPRSTEPMNFIIESGFNEKITDEDRARFYRAFDLTPGADWLSLTKPIVYLKGDSAATVGVLADLAGREPGLYSAKIKATRKSDDTLFDGPIHEFDLVVNVLVPHRLTLENRGRIQATGKVEPGFVDRVFVEVPPGTTALALDLRMLEGGRASSVGASLYDPEGVQRGGVGSVSEQGKTENHATLRNIVPGTWEIVVNSSIRSRAAAEYDLAITLSGVDFGDTLTFSSNGETTRKHLLVPLRSHQGRTFSGTVSGKVDGFVKEEIVEVDDTDTFTRTVYLDGSTGTAKWTVEFDRETYALFTDCVLRLEEEESGKVIRNSGLGQRSGAVSLPVPKNQKEPKAYKLVLIPAFSLKKDSKKWRFTLTEELKWSTGALPLEPVSPRSGRVMLQPWDWMDVEFLLPARLPAAPDGYGLKTVLDVMGGNPAVLIHSETVKL